MTKYIDRKEIGEGGFGKVTITERDSDGRQFAKKTLLTTADDEGRERFIREVRLLSKLDHPNVVPVIATRLQSQPYFYVMPLYRTSLADELSSVIGNTTRTHRIFTSILDAIEYAHAEGVIHRDLKPDNVLLNDDSEIVVSDFGLGRLVTSETTRKTRSGPGLGTWQYMAPEQIRDMKSTDHRADIFSLGRILYELYTEPLFSAVQDISRLPPEIAVIVERATQARPEARYDTVSDMKLAWLTAIGAIPALSAYDEVQALLSLVIANGGSNRDEVQRLLDLVVSHQEDRDLVHETVMKGRSVVAQMSLIHRNLTRMLVRTFVEHAKSQGWGFSYTDKIGDCCEFVYASSNDPQIRADVIYCAMEVGASHNRWHVMEKCEAMMYATTIPGETSLIAERIRVAPQSIRDWAAGRFTRTRVDDVIADVLWH